MTDALLPSARFAESEFRVGRVLNQTWSVFSRNLWPFLVVTLVASVPYALTIWSNAGAAPAAAGGRNALAGFLTLLLWPIVQAVLVFGAFEDMRGRPVNLLDSLRIGLRRFFPVLAVALCTGLLAGLGMLILLVPGFMVLTMLFVATPACVVERLGPIKSMGRSAKLTKGHRWKIFGLWFTTALVQLIVQSILGAVARTIGGLPLAAVVVLLWSAIYGAFSAILAVVTYHDLRVVKEGVDTDQIAAVFD